jgi:hypothetical protein
MKGTAMLKVVKACTPWLSWKNVGIAALVVGGLMLCTRLPNLSILAGVAPLLLLAACLAPCLVPLTLLRRKNQAHGIVQVSEEPGQAANNCGCGQDACRIDGQDSCQSEHVAAETVRS